MKLLHYRKDEFYVRASGLELTPYATIGKAQDLNMIAIIARLRIRIIFLVNDKIHVIGLY